MKPEITESTSQIASKHDIGSSIGASDTCATTKVAEPSKKRRRHSVRFRLASLVVACVLPVWIAAGYLVYRNSQSKRALTEQRMLETARALTMVVDRELANIEGGLSVLATSGALASDDLSAFYRRAQVVLETHPDAYIILADATGQEFVNTFRSFGAPLPKRNVPPDVIRQVYASGKPFITGVYKSAVSGRPQISVEVPVFRGGQVIYDLGMTVPADHFDTILVQQYLPPEWVGRIFDSNHVVIARNRLSEKYVGRQAAPALLQRLKDARGGIAESSNFEGIPMLNGFSRSVTSGWIVVIGVSKATMMAEIWHWLWWTLAGTALLSLTGIALALPIGRSVEQTERRLRRLSAIVESSDDAIIGYGLDGIIESWNRGAERLFGYSAPEILGQHISILITDDQLEGFPDRLWRVHNAEVVEQDTTTRKHKDGSPIPVSFKISPTIDPQGAVVGASAIVRDITERKQAEQQLRTAADRLKAILDNAPVGVDIVRRDGSLVESNAAYQRITGYSGDELIGMNFKDFTHPEDLPCNLELFDGMTTGVTQAYTLEKRYIRKDGSTIWVRVIGSWLSDDQRIGIVEDITERKRAEQSLRESEERFRKLLEKTPLPLGLVDEDGVITFRNERFIRVFGYTAEDVPTIVEWWQRAYADPQYRQWAIARWDTAVRVASAEGRDIEPLEANITCKGGDVRVVEISGITLGKEFLGTFIDITDRKQAEEQREKLEQQLRQAQKMEAVGQLAGGIAHDFNNLLMVIQSYTEMLQDSLPVHDRLRRNTQEIMKAAERAASLTRQMLAYSRKQILCPVVLDLNVVINETAKMLRRLIGEDIEFESDRRSHSGRVEADSDQIVQVLMNLCVNARDAMPQGGTLTIATGNVTVEEGSIAEQEHVPPGDYVWLSVTDTGAGISKENQERIFDPFFTTKEVGKGTGLGLAMVYGIVKQSGGYVWVDSEVGQGACFTVYLPRVKGTVATEMPAKAEAQPRGTGTILVAEDEEALREAMCGYLRSLGYTVLGASSGKEALSVASQHEGHIELLITDLVMPGMGGRELSQTLGSLRPDLKTICMSGYSDDAVLRHGIHELGAAFLAEAVQPGHAGTQSTRHAWPD